METLMMYLSSGSIGQPNRARCFWCFQHGNWCCQCFVDQHFKLCRCSALGGTNYYNPTSPYISDGVAAPTSSDIIRFNPAGWRTLSFDSEVRNLYFAFVSMNGNGYRFDRDFDIISQTDNPDTSEDEGGGNGYWGSGWAEKLKSSSMDKLIGSSERSMVNRMVLSSSRVPFRI